MKMRVTFGSATCSVDANGENEFNVFFSACEGAFAAQGLTFSDAAVDYLTDRDFVVLTQDEMDEMLEDARSEGRADTYNNGVPTINDLPKAKAAFSQEDYDAGYNDGYNGDDAKDDGSPSYNEGWQVGADAFDLGEE